MDPEKFDTFIKMIDQQIDSTKEVNDKIQQGARLGTMPTEIVHAQILFNQRSILSTQRLILVLLRNMDPRPWK